MRNIPVGSTVHNVENETVQRRSAGTFRWYYCSDYRDGAYVTLRSCPAKCVKSKQTAVQNWRSWQC